MTGAGRVGLALACYALLTAGSADPAGWRVYLHRGDVHSVRPVADLPARRLRAAPCPPMDLPAGWDVRSRVFRDVTGDGEPECLLAVWRPWRDRPAQRWSPLPSPVRGLRDGRGDSAHVILVRPKGGGRYREVWAGSALARPVLQAASADVDGDGRDELVALEGDYAEGRAGPARRLAVWRWSGFGFTLGWRSEAGRWRELALVDLEGDGAWETAVR